MAQEAEAMAVANGFDQDDRRCVILCGEDWHPGVVGIVASRMVERLAARRFCCLEKTTFASVRLTVIPFILALRSQSTCAKIWWA